MIEIKKYRKFNKTVFIKGEIVKHQVDSDARIVEGNVMFEVLDINNDNEYFNSLPHLISNKVVSKHPSGRLNVRRIVLDGKHLKT